jgi:hypothetical protein
MRQLILDANLMVLLIVGLKDRALIARHKRTQEFCDEDFELLQSVIGNFDRIVVTPNILTECSNPLRQIGDPACTELTAILKTLVEGDDLDERYLSSREAVRVVDFPRLGLTDAGVLEVVSRDLPLLTIDLDLYLAASRKDAEAATNFNHLRAV